ncbi:MAG: PTS sugar transporter subunit IIB [Thermodesulfobacteriota bacterium]|nr:PTS sugar transporter subunit IIB [Thermodesulfobacteriota bacterium]
MYWVRIDNRLIHGQIIESWLPFTQSKMIVVANDDSAKDSLRREIMGLAIPRGIQKAFSTVEEIKTFLTEKFGPREDPDVFILFADCGDARRAHKKGLTFSRLNIGNLHYSPGKKQICAHVALGKEDLECLSYFSLRGVKLDFRCVPNEPVQVNQVW